MGGCGLCWAWGRADLPEQPMLCPTSGNRAWKALTRPVVLGAAPSLPGVHLGGPFRDQGLERGRRPDIKLHVSIEWQVPGFWMQVRALARILDVSLANFETSGTLPTTLTGLWSCS